MNEDRKVDFKKHQLPPVSKSYLLRIVIYIVLLTALGFAIKYLYTNEINDDQSRIDEIDDVTIEIPD